MFVDSSLWMAILGLNSRASHPKIEEYKLEDSYSNPFYVDRQWSIYWFGSTFVKTLSPGGNFLYYEI